MQRDHETDGRQAARERSLCASFCDSEAEGGTVTKFRNKVRREKTDMKRFIKDMRRYLPYTKYAAKSGLKSEVATSHLSWLWWILDPVLFMLVYWFIFMVIFGQKKEYFHIFCVRGPVHVESVQQDAFRQCENSWLITGAVVDKGLHPQIHSDPDSSGAESV